MLKQRVPTFAPNCGKPGPVLTESGTPLANPEAVAFNNTKGIVYVGNLYGPSDSPGNVAVFPKGKLTPSTYLTQSTQSSGYGVGVDSEGDVFQIVDQAYGKGFEVVEWRGGKMPGTVLPLGGLVVPNGITFDKRDNMLLFNDRLGVILKYPPPYSGAPSRTYTSKNPACAGTLNRNGTRLYAASRANGSVDAYTYPEGRYLYSITAGLSASGSVTGVAIDPIYTP